FPDFGSSGLAVVLGGGVLRRYRHDLAWSRRERGLALLGIEGGGTARGAGSDPHEPPVARESLDDRVDRLGDGTARPANGAGPALVRAHQLDQLHRGAKVVVCLRGAARLGDEL